MDYNRVRALYRRYTADVVGIIYNNFVHQVPKVRTQGLLKREFKALERELGEMTYVERSYILSMTRNFYGIVSKNSLVELRKVDKQVNYQEYIKNRSSVVFEAVKSKLVNNDLVLKTINEGVRMHEYGVKSEFMNDLLADKDGYTPFVICDVHPNCAKDHLAYQGKIYYKDGWENYVSDDAVRAKVSAYIKNHDCMSVKEVTSAPVYLIYRPNCRHTLSDVPIDEVLTRSVRRILKDRGLVRAEFTNKTEADRAHRAYLDRVELYRELWKVAPNQSLASEMNKTRKLYKKWLNLSRK